MTCSSPLSAALSRAPQALPFLSTNDENGFEKLVRHHSEHCIESFNVDFHPYDYGVVDTVAQVLASGDSRVNVHLTALDV